MAQKYGKTAWGRAWIEALEEMDRYSNRLPRGRSYANKGAVRTVRLDEKGIVANVAGSRPTPYKITIRFEKFSESDIRKIQKTIEEYPSIVYELGLGKMPELLLAALEQKGIQLFPAHWDDLDPNCSCPDWANPCKHLAAVYYIVANEIDKNPFLLFQVRGLTLEKLLPSTEHIEHITRIPTMPQPRCMPPKSIRPRTLPDKLEDVHWFFPAQFADTVFVILNDNPLFYANDNFKVILRKIYKKASFTVQHIDVNDEEHENLTATEIVCAFNKQSGRFEAYIIPPEGSKTQPFKHLRLNTKREEQIPVVKGNSITWKTQTIWLVPLTTLVEQFFTSPLELDATSLQRHSASTRFMNAAVALAMSFAAAGAFIPHVYRAGDTGYSVYYMPQMHRDEIRAALRQCASLMPDTFAFYNDQSGILLYNDEQAFARFFSEILTAVLHTLFSYNNKIDVPHDRFIAPFLGNTPFMPAGFQEDGTAKSLYDWLARLDIQSNEIVLSLRIEQKSHKGFTLTVDVTNTSLPLPETLPLSRILQAKSKKWGKTAHELQSLVSRTLIITSEYLPELTLLLNSTGVEFINITPERMYHFLNETVPVLKFLGIFIVLPKQLHNILRPQLIVHASAPTSAKTGGATYLSLLEMLQFSYEVALGDTMVSAAEFRKLLRTANGLVAFRDGYMMISPEEVQSLLSQLNTPPPHLTGRDAIHAALSGEVHGMVFQPDKALQKALRQLTEIHDIPLPTTINATLRPYQERGVRWLYSNITRNFGSILADDMGLGKTLQVLTLIVKLKSDGKLKKPALVICPTTLVGNWQKEAEKFTPSLRVRIFHGSQRQYTIKGVDIFITTYGVVRRDITLFQKEQWGAVIIDEAQAIKNPGTDQSKAIKKLRSEITIALTGTPVENRLTELWSLFEFVYKGFLGSLKSFKEYYVSPIEKYRDLQRTEQLRKITSPFILRRLKTDKAIISDLPEKIITDEFCSLTKEQAALYEKEIQRTMHEIESNEGIARQGLIFKLITALKQICNHPVHYGKKGTPAVVASGKAERCVELLRDILDNNEKTLVFTQYKEMGDLLGVMLGRELNEETLFFHGGLTRAKRDAMVQDFQNNPARRILIISLKAGGTGLNLTAASHIIHYDLWWNPAVENQATDRAYRIGQHRNVFVHRLITLGTFEEKINDMLQKKQELANLTIGAGERWIHELSNAELREIFTLNR